MPEVKNYDAEFCGNLPIHHINSIQDYGYLWILSNENLDIIQVSENLEKLTSKKPAELIQTNFADFITEEEAKTLKHLVKGGNRDRVPLDILFQTKGETKKFELLLHIKTDYTIVEMEEKTVSLQRSFSAVFQEVRRFISSIENTTSLAEVCEVAIHELQRISGFDGIRMYRFDENWNGTVIAEVISGELESYLGHTFPASDVPKQARALYLKNPFRLIPNRFYQASKIYPVINPITNSFIDLSDCNLRGVAAVHLEYMENMKVQSSMSIRVMRNGALWGLISCHHQEANYLDVELRSIFDWLSMEISNRIAAILNQEDYENAAFKYEKRGLITDQVYAQGDIIQGLLEDENHNLLSLFNATGVVVKVGNQMESSGIVPDRTNLENMMLWLEGKGIEKLYSSNHFSDVYEDAQGYTDIVSGVLVIPIDGRNGDYIVCFRPEVIQNIKWGGNPDQAINFEKDTKKYHPRNSFKLWMQTVYGQSAPWTETELDVAESIRNFMFEFRTKQLYN